MIWPLGTYHTVPFDVAQPGRAQADGFDDACGLAEVDDVADAVLVLDEHEDARQEVLHEALRPEADGDADDAGAGDDRTEVDAELAEDRDRRRCVDDRGAEAAQDRADGLRLAAPRTDAAGGRSAGGRVVTELLGAGAC